MTYAINAQYNFYSGTLNVMPDGLLRSSYDNRVIAFTNRAEADALVRMLSDHGDGPYMLSHGQYSSPDYTITASRALPMALRDAMIDLGLQYDFSPDGNRLDTADLGE